MSLKKACRAALLGLLAWGCVAVADDASSPAGSSLRFRHLGIGEGLAQSSVQAILQDRDGYMWFGTQDGLQRYDGYEFLTLRHDPADPASLADNTVNALALDQGGAIWVGTGIAGVDRLDPNTRRFTHFRNDPHDPASLASDSVSVIYQDREHRLWIGTGAGLELFDGQGFRHHPIPAKQPNGDSVYSLYEDKLGRLWVGTDHGLYYLDPATDKVLPFMPDGAMSDDEHGVFTESPIHALGEAGDMLWVASGRGIVVLDAKRMARRFLTHSHSPDSLSNDHALSLLQDVAGDMWVGTYSGGLDHFEPATGRFSSYQHDATDPGSLGSDDVDVLYRDRSGLIWIGTGDGGVDIYNPRTRAFGYYRHKQGDANSVASNLVWSIYKDAEGQVWVGTDHGLTRLDASRRSYRQYHMGQRPSNRVDDDQVSVVYGDRHGNIWTGTDYGLYRYLPGLDRFQRYELIGKHDNPNGDIVSSIYDDSLGRLWAGTGDGLVQVDVARGRLGRFRHDESRADSLPAINVITICETSTDQRLWIGTSGGLAAFDGAQDHFTVYRSDPKDPHSLSYDNIQSCREDEQGGLWVGTADGLNHMQGGKFTRYFASDGLPNDTIYATLPDADGGLWISTDDGLSHLDPHAGSFRNYLAGDGLQSDEFNGGAGFAAPDGELFFGGVNGMNAFHPEGLSRDVPAPAVAITRFLRQDAEVPLVKGSGAAQDVDVQYRQNTLHFEFTTFDYTKPELNQFSYRLDGFDTEWHTLRGGHAVTYTNLDPGRYLLRVKGANSDGVWSEHEASLGLEVQPPAWRSGWALLLYVASAFVLVMLAMGLYKRSIGREHQLKDEQQRRQWAEALHNLIHSVTAQRDERGIGEQLVDSLTNFITYERALFYVEREGSLKLVASRGIGVSDQEYLEHWPAQHPRLVAQLKQVGRAQLLSPEDAATLAGGARAARQHYLAVPLSSGNGGFRLLLVGRPNKPLDTQQMEVASAMAKQVSVALDNAKLIQDLEDLATTDGLTRLYNKRHFMERAESEFVRSRRYHRELSLMRVDADQFKDINRIHGRDAGDRALRLLADTCRAGLRQLDVVGRFGGEELVILLPETTAGEALETAERLRRGVELLQLPAVEGEFRISVSIGIATVGAHTASVAALMDDADRALYAAKRAGRNRVVAATHPGVKAD